MAISAVGSAVYWVMLAFVAAVTIVTALTQREGKSYGKTDRGKRPGIQLNTCDSQKELAVVYGRSRITDLNRVFTGLSGADNESLHLVYNVCEGPIEGIRQIAGVDQLFLDDRIYTEFGSAVYYEFFTGTATQAVCSTLHAACPEWNLANRYTAYLYLRIQFDTNKFQGLPQVSVEVEGLKCYNPATEVTEYTRNPALHALDFLTRSSSRGGLGIDSARIDEDSITGTAAYCTAKGWTCDLNISDNQAVIDNLKNIMATYRGTLIYSDMIFKMKYRDLNYESSVMDITEDDIVASPKSTLRIKQPDIFDTPNTLRMKYPNEETKYKMDDFCFPDNAAIISDGYQREETINLSGVCSLQNVQKMANYFLERMRINKETSFTGRRRLMSLEPFDIIRLTHSRPGWVNKYFRVEEARALMQGSTVALALTEEDEAFYDDVYNLASHNAYTTTLPDPRSSIPNVTNVTQSEEVYDFRGRSFTRWKINFSPPATTRYPWWDGADIYLQVAGGDWKFMASNVRSDYQVDPVQEGVFYQLCIVSVSIFGSRQYFGEGLTISTTIKGKSAIPSDVTNFTATAAGNVVTFNADPVTDPDVVGYEIRMGVSWGSGSFIGLNLSPNFRASYVAPGAQTFWIAAKDNSGNYSATPTSVACTVPYPTSYDYKTDWEWDYTTGTHSNTEHTTNNADDALKCSHTAGVLTGTWQSPTYDFGSVKSMKIYGDFITDFHAGGKTWAGLFPGTWEAKKNKTWDQILNTEYQGTLTAVLHYGSAAWNENSISNFESLAPEIEARYVRVDITLTDPESDANVFVGPLNMMALTYV